ncbi:hypothetical protein [Myroides sp.]|uniref:hypothetical protein n=1 Tax=Myroides sp. TaxID=1874736 RepID=UPI003F678282
MRKLKKWECFSLLCLTHYYLLHLIFILLMFVENGRTIDVEALFFLFILGPFSLMILSWYFILPTVILMLVITSYRKNIIQAYWYSIGSYLIVLVLFFLGDDLIPCLASNVVTVGVVTAIFWKACKRLEIESRDEEALELDNNI